MAYRFQHTAKVRLKRLLAPLAQVILTSYVEDLGGTSGNTDHHKRGNYIHFNIVADDKVAEVGDHVNKGNYGILLLHWP